MIERKNQVLKQFAYSICKNKSEKRRRGTPLHRPKHLQEMTNFLSKQPSQSLLPGHKS